MTKDAQRVCIVTGGSNGIGFATAQRFLREGYRVSICGRRQDALNEAVSQLGDAESVVSVCGDIGQASTRQKLVDETISKFGRVDVLVNNAGAAPLGEFAAIEESTFDDTLNTNVRAPFLLTQSVWPTLLANSGGTVINISSLAAIDPFPGFSIYGASKAWIELFTKAIATEGAEHSIRVCCVRPGAVETDLLRGLFPDFPADQCVSPDEIAEKVWACVNDPDNHPSGEAFTVSK
jgi:NAD(P)-dependent dehydrogenase (short-subunit alcohol dehydrogenase family)